LAHIKKEISDLNLKIGVLQSELLKVMKEEQGTSKLFDFEESVDDSVN